MSPEGTAGDQNIQKKGGELRPYLTRRTSVNDVGKGDRAERGINRLFNANEGAEVDPISEIPDNIQYELPVPGRHAGPS